MSSTKFNWNYSEISSRYKELKKIQKNSNCNNDYLEDTINNYKEILNSSNQDKLCNENFGSLEKLIEYYLMYINDLDKPISDSLLSFIKKNGYKTLYEKDKTLKLNTIEITDEELEEQSYDLFGHLDKNYQGYLWNIFHKNLIHIDKIPNEEVDNYGKTYLDFVNRLGYALINNESSINLISTFNHEITHIMEIMMNPSLSGAEGFIFTEARALFIDMLTQYEILKKGGQHSEDAFKELVNLVNTYKKSIRDLEIINHLSYLDKLSDKSVVASLKNNYGISVYNKKEVRNNISFDSLDSIAYLYSFLLSLHMFDNYVMDEEKGIYLFNKSMETDTRDNLKYLKELEFNPNDSDYINDLYKKYKNKFNTSRVRK